MNRLLFAKRRWNAGTASAGRNTVEATSYLPGRKMAWGARGVAARHAKRHKGWTRRVGDHILEQNVTKQLRAKEGSWPNRVGMQRGRMRVGRTLEMSLSGRIGICVYCHRISPD